MTEKREMLVVRPEPRSDRFSWEEGDLVFNKYPAPPAETEEESESAPEDVRPTTIL